MVLVSAETENVVSAAVSVTAVTEESGFSRSLVVITDHENLEKLGNANRVRDMSEN